jgi:hypothetical protein
MTLDEQMTNGICVEIVEQLELVHHYTYDETNPCPFCR